jgi:hypothetical protein
MPQTVDFIAAGREAEDYVRRVHDLDWHSLYANELMGEYLGTLRSEWAQEYDFVLLDSRTGLTDIGGVCTVHLPDVVVSLFTANRQSMDGTKLMAERLNQQRRDFYYSPGQAIILPLLSRWEEKDAPDDARQWWPEVEETVRPSFDAWRIPSATVTRLTQLLKIPYKAKWNFGERIVIQEESETDPGSVSYHLHLVAALLARDFADTDSLVNEPENYVLQAADGIGRRGEDSVSTFSENTNSGVAAFVAAADSADDTLVIKADGDLQRRNPQSPPETRRLVEFLMMRKLQVLLRRQATLDELAAVATELNELRVKNRQEPLVPPTAASFARMIEEEIQLLSRK